jgi:hypothetical protein
MTLVRFEIRFPDGKAVMWYNRLKRGIILLLTHLQQAQFLQGRIFPRPSFSRQIGQWMEEEFDID